MSVHEIDGYKEKQLYNYAEIKADEIKIFDQYISLLNKYEETLNHLKMFESVKTYILEMKLKPNAKIVLINGQILSVYKRFNGVYLKVETDNV